MNIINPYRFAGAGTGYLLDDYTGATAGYSLRALASSYETTNDVALVVRTGDSTTSGFTASEVADGSLESWVSAGGGTENGYVRAWYDQSGNGNNATNIGSVTSVATMAQVVSGGTLLTDGLLFNGSGSAYDCRFNHGTASAQSIFTVAATTDLTANRMLIDGRDANDDGIGMFYLTSSDYMRFHVDTTDVFSNTSLSTSTKYLFSGIYGSTTSTFYEDGTQTDTDTGAPSSSSSTTDYKIGRTGYASSAFWKGNINEVIIYPDDQSANRTGIESNIKTHYGIT